ncbi:MAG: glycosyltransferase family 2 protein [Thermodesulfobacteriota bacterium]
MKAKKEDCAVEILLATYNGGRFLSELLASLLAQTYKDWRLVVRDDGSTDGTIDIIKKFRDGHPGRVVLIEDTEERLGACGSFSLLLERSEAPYIMFCDQDDVWLPEKVERTLEKMRELEGGRKEAPVLVHTDMIVVDEELNKRADSFWRYQNLPPEMKGLNNLLILNNVTGCAAMINKALKRLSVPVPDEAIIHDWWVAIVAAAMGEIGHIDSPTILYRQHGENVKGARRYSYEYFASRLFSLGRTAALLRRIVKQAAAFLRIYGDRLPEGEKVAAGRFAGLLRMGRIKRVYTVFRYRFWGRGFLRNLGLCLIWIVIKGEKSRPSMAVKDNA